jgi:putative flavoprotein involved in K+ transport
MSAGINETVDTLVIGGGQAGLATSYWLTNAGIEHLVVDGRDRLGGSWPSSTQMCARRCTTRGRTTR